MRSETGAGSRLSFFEATCIIAGCGIGAGILAVPWLVSLSGVVPALAVLVVAFLFSLLFHLMVAEAAAGAGGGLQVLELLRKYLFTGRYGTALTWLFFALVGTSLLTNLAAYVAGGGEVLAAGGLGRRAGEALFYAAAASIALAGLKALGKAEKWAVGGMALLFAGLVAASIASLVSSGAASPVKPAAPSLSRLLALYGMGMFCFMALYAVPQAVKGLADRPRLIPRAVAAGLGINFAIMLVVVCLSLLLSPVPTKIATIGWSRSLGSRVEAMGTAFVLLAMLTSYWSVSLALADIVRERLGTGRFVSWLLATLPTLLIPLAGIAGFMEFLRKAGGAMGLLVPLLLIPMNRRSRRMRERSALLSPALFSPHWDWIVAIAYLAMAAGSMVPVK